MNTILKRPLVTEKAMTGTRSNHYGFIVDQSASKHQIREAVETMFSVDVVSITTMTGKGKTKRVGKKRQEIQTSPYKKAFIKIKAGQTIDVVPTMPTEEARA